MLGCAATHDEEMAKTGLVMRYGGIMLHVSRCGLFRPTVLTIIGLAALLSLILPAAPAAAAIDAAASSNIVTFGYTGSQQSWIVPPDVTSIGVDAEGAQGSGTFGGLGGWTHAVVPVTPGDVVNIFVGGQGHGAAAGWNGGGDGGCCGAGAGGGGASDVRIGGTELSNRIVVAGGGGGSLGDIVFGQGGAGGDNIAGAGGDGSGQWHGGGGGTQTSGGTTGGNFATAGSLGQGGVSHFGGSGGGGYYGGGGGEGDSYGGTSGGGGGGSSYVGPSALQSSFLAGEHQGDGRAVISYSPTTVPPADTSSSTATFAYTGTPQYYRVPAGVIKLQVDLHGAQGGTPSGSGGGLGGRVQATIPVQPFQLLMVAPGGAGKSTTAGWNGGGGGGCCDRGVAGGGASDIRIGGLTLSNRQLVAGGGGGGAGTAFSGEPGGVGGAGGGTTGNAGGDGSGQWHGGGGGTPTSGGTTGGNFAEPGRLGQGGVGHYGGSGGGGYYGGGGGEGDSYGGTSGGGGGGSGYVTSKAVESLQQNGENTGDGTITISAVTEEPPPPPPPPPSSPPLMRAGDFDGVLGKSPKPPKAANTGRGCTAGFAVLKATTRFMLTADHCRAWLDKNGNEVGRAYLVDIKGPTPPATVAGDQSAWVTYASELSCTGSGDLCLRQPERAKANDVMAWRPDPGTVTPTGEVQTNHGVFAVLGNGDWKLGQRVCQMGVTTGVEKCGSILKKKAFDQGSGYVAWRYDDPSQHVLGGDSGGPVYSYVYNSDGSIKGVLALGINEAFYDDDRCLYGVCNNYFLPIATIMQQLGVTVLNTR
jgi:hypothetical protein